MFSFAYGLEAWPSRLPPALIFLFAGTGLMLGKCSVGLISLFRARYELSRRTISGLEAAFASFRFP